MITKDEDWVSICEFDKDGEIVFTQDYLKLFKGLNGEARRFAAQLITQWTNDFISILDYFGPEDQEEDKYSGVDGEPMDVREDTTDLWEYYGKPYEGLSGEWHRDVLRSKLINLKLPARIIKEYVKLAKKEKIKS